MRVNLKSVYAVIHYAAPHMIAQRGGRIIAISSGACAARLGLSRALCRVQRRDHKLREGPFDRIARHNILVNCVAPGWVETEMSAPVLKPRSGRESR